MGLYGDPMGVAFDFERGTPVMILRDLPAAASAEGAVRGEPGPARVAEVARGPACKGVQKVYGPHAV